MPDAYEPYDRWTWKLGRWWDNYGAFVAIALIAASLVFAVRWISRREEATKARACAAIMATARTARDTLDVRLRCDVPAPAVDISR